MLEVVDVGVDWLQTTVHPGEGVDDWIELFENQQIHEMERGFKEKSYSEEGYRGRTVGQVSYGSRWDGCMFKATGRAAHRVIPYAFKLKWSGNVPRLDLQFTGNDNQKEMEEPLDMLAKIEADRKREKKRRRRFYGIAADIAEADTFIINKRGHASHGRIYLACAKHGEIYSRSARRFECEFRDKLAHDYYNRLRRAENLEQKVLTSVVSQMQRWDVDAPIYGLAEFEKPPTQYVAHNSHSNILWFFNQVRPALHKRDAEGLHDLICKALCLKNYELDTNRNDDEYLMKIWGRILELGTQANEKRLMPEEAKKIFTLEVAQHSDGKRKLKKGGIE